MEQNIYDLVERTAARRGWPRLELWRSVLSAVQSGELKVTYDPKIKPPWGWPAWVAGARAAVDRRNDPNGFARGLESIFITTARFNKWLRSATLKPRGPQRGTTGYREADRRALPKMRRLIDSGKVRSGRSAALALIDAGVVHVPKNVERESVAKRLSARYREIYD
jgi:hypothetical protein